MNEVDAVTRKKDIYKVTIIGGIVNFLLLAFKFAAGIMGHSVAMLADAVHSLSDFVTDVIVIVFVRISNKPQDKAHVMATAIEQKLKEILGRGTLVNIHVEPRK